MTKMKYAGPVQRRLTQAPSMPARRFTRMTAQPVIPWTLPRLVSAGWNQLKAASAAAGLFANQL
jgi:hypothetical protein